MANAKLRSLVVPKKTLINLKVTAKEMKEIKANAVKYAAGNYSAWLRYAAMNFKPTKKEMSDVK